jgi:hypothetical protein
MISGFAKMIKGFSAAVVLTIAFCFSATAQEPVLKSRVAVVTNETKTNIWVSDFPKNTSIVVFDSENNLLSILSTNNFGAAFLSLPKGIKTGVLVKTLDGEVSASNKSVIKNKQEEQNVVANYNDDSNKA